MSDIAVKVEGLGKRYRIPHGNGSQMRTHLKEFFGLFRNDEADTFWALRDLDFELKQGEIIGILGKNGSGKSTLLKILSGVTVPTTGRAVLRGRIGSLLEVGAGFHPDLSGRENVFMNGSLLGMSRREVASKMERIVDFAGIEKFIDMPVKRYSSGMYVRLAYSVASHLNTDVLILDEVLAVGDAEFRKKSLGNMERLSREGRTILFVSHNSTAVQALCQRGLILDQGRKIYESDAANTVRFYLRKTYQLDRDVAGVAGQEGAVDLRSAERAADGQSRVISWAGTYNAAGEPTNEFSTGEPMLIRIGYDTLTTMSPYFSVLIMNTSGDRVATISSTHSRQFPTYASGKGEVECVVDDLRLGSGEYSLMIDYGHFGGSREQYHSLDSVPNALNISVQLKDFVGGIGHDAFQGAAHKSSWVAK